jgi:MFS family permease
MVANRRLPPREAPASSTSPATGLALAPLLRGLPLFVYLGVIFTGLSWGMVDTALPPRLVELGSRAELWGGLAALLSVTSALGGLLHAGMARPASALEALWRSLLFLGLWSGLLLPLGFTEGLVSTAVWLAAAGFFLAPLVGLLTYLLQQALPADRQSEGFALYGTSFSLGIGAGSALTAVFLERASLQAALIVSGGVPLALVLGAALLARPLLRAAARALPPLKSAEAPKARADEWRSRLNSGTRWSCMRFQHAASFSCPQPGPSSMRAFRSSRLTSRRIPMLSSELVAAETPMPHSRKS